MKIGFTGTREGMTEIQKNELYHKLVEYGATEFHHGDCVGADAEAHVIAYGLKIVIHPPEDDSLRAYCESDFILDPLPHLKRNKAIVDQTDVLFATPKEMVEELRSGTWSTIRYANKRGKKVEILYPSGVDNL